MNVPMKYPKPPVWRTSTARSPYAPQAWAPGFDPEGYPPPAWVARPYVAPGQWPKQRGLSWNARNRLKGLAVAALCLAYGIAATAAILAGFLLGGPLAGQVLLVVIVSLSAGAAVKWAQHSRRQAR